MNLHIAPGPLPYLDITLTVTNFEPGDPIHLARWRPGRYEAANYTKFIRNVQCKSDNGEIIALQKSNFYTWHPQISESTSLVFTYQYYADQLDAGSTYADTDICYLNFHNFVLFSPGKLDDPIYVFIDLPDDFMVATSLHEGGKHQWVAKNFHHLADSPLLASNALYSLKYDVDDVPFSLWFHNLNPSDHPTIVKDFEAFTRQQIHDIGQFPTSEYHFLIITYPQKLYHGVEHGSSTVICLGPSEKVLSDGYDDLLGISSHELFHAWNIIQVRPKEFRPYDFSSIVSIDTGFVAEGFTTYLGDLFLVRSGARDTEWYLKELSILFQRHFENLGRLETSLIDSSRDLWADGYQLAGVDRKGSIYVEGAVFALIIDLTLRINSDSAHSLLDVIQEMVKSHSVKGYTANDIENIVNNYSDLSELFKTYLHAASDTRPVVKKLLQRVGLSLTEEPNPNKLERRFGIRVRDINGTWTVLKVHADSGSALRRGDTVIEIDGMNSLDDEVPDGDLTITIERKGVKNAILLSESSNEYFPLFRIIQERQTELLKNWLNNSV